MLLVCSPGRVKPDFSPRIWPVQNRRIPSRVAALHLLYTQTATVGIWKMPKVQNQAFSMRDDVLDHREKSCLEISDSNGQSSLVLEGNTLN